MILKILDRYSHNQWVLLGQDGKLYIKGFPKENKGGVKIVIGNKIGIAKYDLYNTFFQIVKNGIIKYEDEDKLI